MFQTARNSSPLTAATALIVVLLAAFGSYGTQRYLVQAGRREYAILAALGAGPRALGRLVLARSLRLGLPGMVLGGLLAFSTVAWMRDEYVSPSVPPGVISILILLTIAGLLLLAALGPAAEARSTQPGPLLKEE
jgi:ABC-type antimicrobial peptide transport system permease subunit